MCVTDFARVEKCQLRRTECSESQCIKHLDLETMSKKWTQQLKEHLVSLLSDLHSQRYILQAMGL
jgi:hypothetical protein